jgi:hypothetical protein
MQAGAASQQSLLQTLHHQSKLTAACMQVAVLQPEDTHVLLGDAELMDKTPVAQVTRLG